MRYTLVAFIMEGVSVAGLLAVKRTTSQLTEIANAASSAVLSSDRFRLQNLQEFPFVLYVKYSACSNDFHFIIWTKCVQRKSATFVWRSQFHLRNASSCLWYPSCGWESFFCISKEVLEVNAHQSHRDVQSIKGYLNKERPTWCHLLYYFTIYCSTCFEC